MSIVFEVIDNDTIRRIANDGSEVFIPKDPENGFYKRYLRWQQTGSEFPPVAL